MKRLIVFSFMMLVVVSASIEDCATMEDIEGAGWAENNRVIKAICKANVGSGAVFEKDPSGEKIYLAEGSNFWCTNFDTDTPYCTWTVKQAVMGQGGAWEQTDYAIGNKVYLDTIMEQNSGYTVDANGVYWHTSSQPSANGLSTITKTLFACKTDYAKVPFDGMRSGIYSCSTGDCYLFGFTMGDSGTGGQLSRKMYETFVSEGLCVSGEAKQECQRNADVVNGECVCLPGYEPSPDGEECWKECGKNGYYDNMNNICKCNSGYVMKNSVCVEGTTCEGENEVYNEKIGMCECAEFFERDESGKCVAQEHACGMGTWDDTKHECDCSDGAYLDPVAEICLSVELECGGNAIDYNPTTKTCVCADKFWPSPESGKCVPNSEIFCDDKIDNDQDGLEDCDDDECEDDYVCTCKLVQGSGSVTNWNVAIIGMEYQLSEIFDQDVSKAVRAFRSVEPFKSLLSKISIWAYRMPSDYQKRSDYRDVARFMCPNTHKRVFLFKTTTGTSNAPLLGNYVEVYTKQGSHWPYAILHELGHAEFGFIDEYTNLGLLKSIEEGEVDIWYQRTVLGPLRNLLAMTKNCCSGKTLNTGIKENEEGRLVVVDRSEIDKDYCREYYFATWAPEGSIDVHEGCYAPYFYRSSEKSFMHDDYTSSGEYNIFQDGFSSVHRAIISERMRRYS